VEVRRHDPHFVANHATPSSYPPGRAGREHRRSFGEDGYGTDRRLRRASSRPLRDLANLNTTAEEGSVRNGGAPLSTPGRTAAGTDHESLKEDTAFFEVKMTAISYTTTTSSGNW
jgi:hypothetical protein